MDVMKDASPEPIIDRAGHPGTRLGYAFALLLFVVGADLYIVAPLLPGIRTTLGVTLAAAGLLVTVFTAGYTLASPFIGGLTDQIGRRAVLYTGLLFFIVFEAVSAWAPNFTILLVARAMTGIVAAAISPTAFTIIGDAVPYRQRGRVMSTASVGFSVSAIAGVPLGLWLSDFWGWRGVLWALTAATAAAAGMLTFVLKAPPAAEPAAQRQPQRRGVLFAETRRILATTGPVLVVSFLAFAVVGLVYTYLVVDLGRDWHWPNKIIVGFLFLYGIANVAGNLVLGRLGDWWSKDRAVRLGQTIELIALLGVAGSSLWHSVWALVLALLTFAFGQAYIPDLKAMASAVPPKLRGRSQAWNNAAMFGGMMVGSWAAAYWYQTIGLSGLSIAAAAVVAVGWVATGATAQHKAGLAPTGEVHR
jgi:MFS transporter, DHA1 family, inner membrane transport protein